MAISNQLLRPTTNAIWTPLLPRTNSKQLWMLTSHYSPKTNTAAGPLIVPLSPKANSKQLWMLISNFSPRVSTVVGPQSPRTNSTSAGSESSNPLSHTKDVDGIYLLSLVL